MHYSVDGTKAEDKRFERADKLPLVGGTIELETSQTADLSDPINETVLIESTTAHQADVKKAMRVFMNTLEERAEHHDWSKIAFHKFFFESFHTFQETGKWPTGKDSFHDTIHIQERHHLNDRVPKDVDLFDILEKIADSVTAAMARNGKYDPQEPADFDKVLRKAYDNTVSKLLEMIKVAPPTVSIRKENN